MTDRFSRAMHLPQRSYSIMLQELDHYNKICESSLVCRRDLRSQLHWLLHDFGGLSRFFMPMTNLITVRFFEYGPVGLWQELSTSLSYRPFQILSRHLLCDSIIPIAKVDESLNSMQDKWCNCFWRITEMICVGYLSRFSQEKQKCTTDILRPCRAIWSLSDPLAGWGEICCLV
jgi:hypothetical protein